MLVPLSQAVFADLFPPRVLGRAFGVMGAVSEVGALIGTTVSTAVSNEEVKLLASKVTMEGWRIPFIALSLLALLLSIWQGCSYSETKHHGARLRKHGRPISSASAGTPRTVDSESERTPLLIEEHAAPRARAYLE